MKPGRLARLTACACSAHEARQESCKCDIPRGHESGPVNLTLNEDLVGKARELTEKLSAVVESLLTDFVEQEQAKRADRKRQVQATVATWNAFNEKFGSFADEHSTL